MTNAGADSAVALGQPVVLDGRASSDPDGDPLAYAWSLVSVPGGSAVTRDDATASLRLEQFSDSATLTANGSASYSEVETEEVLIDDEPVLCTYATNNAFGILSGTATGSSGASQINLAVTSGQFSYTGSPAECGSGSCQVTGTISLTR